MPAEAYVNENRFFSYKRFVLNKDFVDSIPADGRVQKTLNIFVADFKNALEAISAGRLEEAKRDLLKARETWPEYFGVDFLLARIYEDQDDYETAARYYKSYLNKLKDLYAGRYRISGPLIRGITASGIEEYHPAHEVVERRLARYGISLDDVRPVFTPPGFLLPSLLVIVIASACVIIYHWLWPYVKRRRLISNPPEGFWICRYCDTANPDLCKECGKCGRPRE